VAPAGSKPAGPFLKNWQIPWERLNISREIFILCNIFQNSKVCEYNCEGPV